VELTVMLKDQAPYALPHGAFCRMTLKIGGPCVKETSRSSTARPQEMRILPFRPPLKTSPDERSDIRLKR
jgi:hypothetical protein